MAKRWNYSGDTNLTCGGFFWQESGYDDHVYAVRITPCSDAGGPNNLFHVDVGSIYMPQDAACLRSVLSCGGYSLDERGDILDGAGGTITSKAKRAVLVEMHMACAGMDRDREEVIRIGLEQEARGWCPEPDHVLRAGAKLENFVRRVYLRP